MCLYPRLIKNPKYQPNKKNGGNPPTPSDKRVMMVPVGCGKCIECRKQKANEWKVRLSEELKTNKGYFVTLTFNEESLQYFYEICDNPNENATMAVRLFCERWRKKYKKAPRHWLITELGHDYTERLHLHGIIFCDEEQIKNLEKIWSYGWVHIGTYCNERTINYIIKYVTKIDNDHPYFEGKILCSKGIGSKYIEREPYLNTYKPNETKEYYKNKQGYKLALPIYYRNKLYNEETREKLWLEKLDKKEIYVTGTKYDVSTIEGIEKYINALKVAQNDNTKNGFGGDKWKQTVYKEQFTKINKNF